MHPMSGTPPKQSRAPESTKNSHIIDMQFKGRLQNKIDQTQHTPHLPVRSTT